jgi:hypothetical protein
MFMPVVSSSVEAARGEFVIAAHHPDRLRRPPVVGSRVAEARFQQAFAWNVFRTLDLLPPAFWTRRLHARLGAEQCPAAPQSLRVHLWKPLPLPPAQRIDGAKQDVIVDVTIETEHSVWTLLLLDDHDRRLLDTDVSSADPVGSILDAAAWRAGRRQHYVGALEARSTPGSIGSVLRQRYSRSRDSVQLRSGARWGSVARVDLFGVIDWADLIDILEDCAAASVLSPIERALARNTLAWIERSGVSF